MVDGMGDGVAATVEVMRWLAITMFCAFGGACTTTSTPGMTSLKAHSPATLHRVYVKMPDASGKRTSQRVGHYTVGKPYVVKGKRYYPKEEPGYDRSGIASWYARGFQGRRTANGETYDPGRLSAAHPTLPLPSYVRVTNLTNGSSVVVRVNDRGPYHKGRLIDISSKAAEMLDMTRRGTASVRVQYVGRAALNGDDMAFLMASQRKRQGPLGVNRPIGAQVAGKPLTSYGERSTLFVGSKSAGNFLAASGLRGRAASYVLWASQAHHLAPLGKASIARETAIFAECCLNKERVGEKSVLQAFLPAAFDRKSHRTGMTGRRSPARRRRGDPETGHIRWCERCQSAWRACRG
ncbi:septal ring lytic transglycosylase RlpA family protein [Ensifer adhaerens]